MLLMMENNRKVELRSFLREEAGEYYSRGIIRYSLLLLTQSFN